MDVLQARDSLNSESDHLFYNSEEFMMEDLLKSPAGRTGALQSLEKSLITNTSNAIEIIRAPPSLLESEEIRKKFTPAPKETAERRAQLQKAGSFCSRLSDGIVVKVNAPTKGKPVKPLEKVRTLAQGLSGLSPMRSPKHLTKGTVARRRHSASCRLLSTPQSKKQSLDCSNSNRSEGAPVTRSIDELEESPVPIPPPPVHESKSWMSSGSEWSDDLSDGSSSLGEPVPHPPLERTTSEPPLPVSLPMSLPLPLTKLERMRSVPEDKDDEMPPPPKPAMKSFPPNGNGLPKRSLPKAMRRSASARLESTNQITLSPLSNATRSPRHEKRLSFQLDEVRKSPGTRNHRKTHGSGHSRSPKPEDMAPRRSSSWLVSPGNRKATLKTSRSKTSSKSASKRKSHINMTGIPKVPVFDQELEQAQDQENPEPKTSPVPFSRRKLPPVMRPLDKTLMRDYPSNNTATTFLTADTDAIDYSMSHMFPLTKETTRLILKKAPNKRDLSIQTPEGESMGSIDYSMVNQGKRIIKDSCGRTCAVVVLQDNKLKGKKMFKICGNKPASRTQRLSTETGYYSWAEVKNSGSLGGKFVMNRFCAETSTCSTEQHSTKPFGSLFSRGKSKGYVFLDDHKKECVKMVTLKKGKGIIVGPNRDLCLMLCYVVCVAEMMEHRLR